jgi:ATP-binding cassette subfamily B protein
VLLDLYDDTKSKQVLDALNSVGLGDKINSLDKGLHSLLTKEFDETGVVLSGGEMQKLALARLFANENPILILDEPSSALDLISEYNIFKQIFDRFKNNTIFFVSHRLYSATLSDKIIVMDKGEIVEMGTHKQLLEKNGNYANLYNVTTENYKIS